MKYNEYIAPEGKVLFNLDDFTYGNKMLSSLDLNLIILDKEEAESLYQAYNDEKSRINEELKEQPITFASRRANIAVMAINDEGEYEETIEEEYNPIEEFKRNAIADLIARGINVRPDINTIKHE